MHTQDPPSPTATLRAANSPLLPARTLENLRQQRYASNPYCPLPASGSDVQRSMALVRAARPDLAGLSLIAFVLRVFLHSQLFLERTRV